VEDADEAVPVTHSTVVSVIEMMSHVTPDIEIDVVSVKP
jgi:hypothetical protein